MLLARVTGNVTVASGTLSLGNSAAIGGDLTNNNMIDLQNTVTTDTVGVAGNFVQGAGGTLKIDVDAVGTAGDTFTVNGTAALAGTIDVNLLTGDPISETTILSAAGGVTNNGVTIGTVVGAVNPITKVELGFPNANDVNISILLNVILGNFNENQTAIATAINNGASNTVLAALLGLPSISATADALDQLSPEIYLNQQTALMYAVDDQIDDLFSCQMSGQGHSVINEGSCVWMRPQGRYLDIDATANYIGATERAGGVSIGAQLNIADMWYAGLALGYERASLSTTSNASGKSDRYHGGAVLKYQNDAFPGSCRPDRWFE